MKAITHKQARRYLRMDLDGLLTDIQRRDFEAHLDSCPACRAEAESFSALTARLQNGFRSRWNAQHGPSENVTAKVRSQTRRISMTRRIDFAFNIFGGLVTFLVLGFVVFSIIGQFMEKAIPADQTQTDIPAPAPRLEDRLIAFVSNVGLGNRDIFTMKADGSDLTNITNNPATDQSPAWSPDGTQIAFVSDRSGGRDIYLMNADGSNVRKLTDSSTYNDHFVWSPDGQKIAYLSSENSLFTASELMVMNADGSNKIALTNEPGTYNILGWSPDGRKIVYQNQVQDSNVGTPLTAPSDAGIHIVDIDGANRHEWVVSNITHVHWEDSEHFIGIEFNWLVGEEQSKWSWSLFRFDTNGNAPIELASHTIPIVAVFDKSYVVEGQDSLSWFAYSGARIPTSPRNFSQTCNTRGFPVAQGTTHTISPDRKQAFVTVHCDGTIRFYLENADGSQFVQLTDFSIVDPAQASGVIWSPDGRYVIATVSNRRGQDIYRFDIQEMLNDPSTQPVQLTTDGVLKYGAVWQPVINPVANDEVAEKKPTPETEKTPSAEGLIAFAGTAEDGNTEIFTIRPDGSGLTNLTNHDAVDSNPAWSPDGKRIAFQSNRAAFTQIYLMDADGSNVTQLTFDQIDHEMSMNYANSSPWSPDGSRLLFFQRVYPEKGSPPVPLELYAMDVNSGNKVMLASGDIWLFNVAWSPDGEHIAYIATDPQNANRHDLFVVNYEGDTLIKITQSLHPNERLEHFEFYWSPDGRSLIFLTINEKSQQWFAYEAFLDGRPLLLKTRSSLPLGGWWDGTSFIIGFDSTLTWLRSDGMSNTLQPLENCQFEKEPQYSFLTRRASNGDLIVSVGCPNGDLWFYWANADGTSIKQLFETPLSVKEGDLNNIVWSPDNKYFVISVFSSDANHFYVVNVEEALSNPSVLPEPMGIRAAEYNVAWQPIP